MLTENSSTKGIALARDELNGFINHRLSSTIKLNTTNKNFKI